MVPASTPEAAGKTTALPKPSSLALVPFVSTAPPATPVASAPDPLAGLLRKISQYRLFCQTTLAWRTYSLLFTLTLRFIFYLPILCMWVFIMYALLLVVQIAANPQVIVAAGFKLLFLFPAYGAWAGQLMLTQLQNELAASFR
eukprot:16439387-Heterocapsa_arctica.AAC.1